MRQLCDNPFQNFISAIFFSADQKQRFVKKEILTFSPLILNKNIFVIYHTFIISVCQTVCLFVRSQLRNPCTDLPQILIGELGRTTCLSWFWDSRWSGSTGGDNILLPGPLFSFSEHFRRFTNKGYKDFTVLVRHEKASRTALQTGSLSHAHYLGTDTPPWLQSRKVENNVVYYN